MYCYRHYIINKQWEKPAKRIYHNGNERVWRALFRCMLDPNVN